MERDEELLRAFRERLRLVLCWVPFSFFLEAPVRPLEEFFELVELFIVLRAFSSFCILLLSLRVLFSTFLSTSSSICGFSNAGSAFASDEAFSEAVPSKCSTDSLFRRMVS